MTPPPIRVWREPIDDKMVVVNADCYVVLRGHLWGLAVFLLIDAEDFRRDRWFDWSGAGERHLKDYVARHYGGRLPWVGPARDGKAAPE